MISPNKDQCLMVYLSKSRLAHKMKQMYQISAKDSKGDILLNYDKGENKGPAQNLQVFFSYTKETTQQRLSKLIKATIPKKSSFKVILFFLNFFYKSNWNLNTKLNMYINYQHAMLMQYIQELSMYSLN